MLRVISCWELQIRQATLLTEIIVQNNKNVHVVNVWIVCYPTWPPVSEQNKATRAARGRRATRFINRTQRAKIYNQFSLTHPASCSY